MHPKLIQCQGIDAKLSSIHGLARPTRDIDLLGYGPLVLETLAKVFKDLCHVDVPPDGLTFQEESVRAERIKDDEEYEGVRVHVTALLDQARITVQIDIAFAFGDRVGCSQRDRSRYDEILEGFSQSISSYIDYEMHQDGSVVVNNQTAHLYRFWDATRFAEYLYDCVADTIRTDLREEIGFLKVFDAAIRATMDIVDMPDRRASLLVRLILQNNGRLSQTKRATFSELKDEEISAIEEAVASLSQDGPSS